MRGHEFVRVKFRPYSSGSTHLSCLSSTAQISPTSAGGESRLTQRISQWASSPQNSNQPSPSSASVSSLTTPSHLLDPEKSTHIVRGGKPGPMPCWPPCSIHPLHGRSLGACSSSQYSCWPTSLHTHREIQRILFPFEPKFCRKAAEHTCIDKQKACWPILNRTSVYHHSTIMNKNLALFCPNFLTK